MQRKTLHEVYLIALARGMTAKQAGAEFGLNHSSISKMKGRFGLPSLISEFEFAARKAMKSLTYGELQSIINILSKDGLTESKDYKYAQEELTNRHNEKENIPVRPVQ